VKFARGKIPLRCKSRRKCILCQYRRRPNIVQSLVDSVERRHYCTNEAKTRNQLKFVGVPQIPERSQPLVGRSSRYCADMWRRYCCLTIFPIVDICLCCEDTARQSCAMVRRWRFLRHFCVLQAYFEQAACSTFQTCILNSY